MLDRALAGRVGSATQEDPRLIVEMWLAVPTAAGWRVLLLLRSEERGPWWQGVSGRAEPDDETLRQTAERELREETGISRGYRLLDLGPWAVFRSAVSDRWYRKRTLGAVLPAGTAPDSITLSDEHVEARLLTFDEARALVPWPGNTEALDALERHLAPSGPPDAS